MSYQRALLPPLLQPAPHPPTRRYGSIEPDPDNPRQSYLDYVESFPLNAEPEVYVAAGS